jgi:hypothetical protein
MSTDGRLRERVERYFASNPDAGVADALGRLSLSPEHWELVAEVRAGRNGDDQPNDTHHVSAVPDAAEEPERATAESDDSGSDSPVETGSDDGTPAMTPENPPRATGPRRMTSPRAVRATMTRTSVSPTPRQSSITCSLPTALKRGTHGSLPTTDGRFRARRG